MAVTKSYRSRLWLLAGLSIAVSALAGLFDGRIVSLAIPGGSWPKYALLLMAAAAMFAAMIPWWRKLDDVQKSGQLVSWFWGGQIGAVVVLLALVIQLGTRSLYIIGGLAVWFGEVACFAIAWLVWRFQVRGPAE